MAEMADVVDVLKYVLVGVNVLLFVALVTTFATARVKGDDSATGGASLPPKKALLVTAHPDDESMFFLPLVHSLTSKPAPGEQQWQLHLLCLSRGNFDGLGAVREKEMEICGAFLGIEKANIHVLEDAKLQDGMQAQWSREHVAEIVLQYMEKHEIDAVFTFDDYGISGHPNHIDVHFGVKQAIQEQHKRCEATADAGGDDADAGQVARHPVKGWALESTNILRKYVGVLDALVMPSIFSSSSAKPVFVFLFRPWWNYQAMALHHSQFVWYRRLFVVFSRYTFINTFKPLVEPSEDSGGSGSSTSKKTQ